MSDDIDGPAVRTISRQIMIKLSLCPLFRFLESVGTHPRKSPHGHNNLVAVAGVEPAIFGI